jgi:hypothetical protein
MTQIKLSADDDIFEQAKIAGLDPAEAFCHEDLSGRNLSNRDLRNFKFIGTQLNGCDMSYAKLNGAKLPDARLCGANLTGAKLCGAQLPDANLNGADLRRADLNGAYLQRADLRNTKLSDTNLSGANVQGTKFGGSIGLTEDMKRDLRNRGAIFKDSAVGDNSPLKADIKWWMQFVFVPLIGILIGSGGIAAIITASKNEHPSPPTPVPTAKPATQATPFQKPVPTTKPTIPTGSSFIHLKRTLR